MLIGEYTLTKLRDTLSDIESEHVAIDGECTICLVERPCMTLCNALEALGYLDDLEEALSQDPLLEWIEK